MGGPVDDDMANLIVAQLLYLDSADQQKDITMYVNSPGGSVTAGETSCSSWDSKPWQHMTQPEFNRHQHHQHRLQQLWQLASNSSPSNVLMIIPPSQLWRSDAVKQ